MIHYIKQLWWIVGTFVTKNADPLMNLRTVVIMCTYSASLRWWFPVCSNWGITLAGLCLWTSFNISLLGLIHRGQIRKKVIGDFYDMARITWLGICAAFTIKIIVKVIKKTHLDLAEGHLGWTWDVAWKYSAWSLELWRTYCCFKRGFVHSIVSLWMGKKRCHTLCQCMDIVAPTAILL